MFYTFYKGLEKASFCDQKERLFEGFQLMLSALIGLPISVALDLEHAHI